MRYLIASAIGANLILAGTTFADTIYVAQDGSGDYTEIQAAVDASSDGDEILVAPGTYTSSGKQVVNMLGKAITLRASGPTRTTVLDGEHDRRVVHCDSGETADTRIEGFMITNGLAEQGGGIYCSGSSPTLDRCWIRGNEAYASLFSEGGGVYLSESNSLFINCTFADNTVGSLVGISQQGGAMYCSLSSPQITGCNLINNSCDEWGGAFEGGGIYSSSDSNPLITDTLLCHNAPDQIFGPWTNGGDTEWSESCPTFELHVPAEHPTIGAAVGLIYDAHVPYFTIVVAPGRYTGHYPYPILDTLGQTFTMRSSRGRDVTILDSGNTRNVAFCAPTDFDQDSVVVLEGFTFINGYTWFESGGGGIMCRETTLTVSDCTIESCTSSHQDSVGGGINCHDSSSLTLMNCTITDNTAPIGPALSTDVTSSTSIADTIICGNGPDQLIGTWSDAGGNCISVQCEDYDGDGQVDWCSCPGDATGDGTIDVNDVLYLISAWDTADPNADFDGDGLVDADDVLILLSHFGEDCP